jgi:hypothetical protein
MAATVVVGAVSRASLTAPSAQGDITPRKQHGLRAIPPWHALAAAARQQACVALIADIFIGHACT